MRKISLVIACLACTSSGRRVQMTEERVHGSLRQEHQRWQNAVDTTGHNSMFEVRDSQQHGDAGASAVKVLARYFLAFNSAAGHSTLDSGRTWATKRAFSVPRVQHPVASGSESSESAEAKRKRIKADRLALEAELAALEIEKLELQAAQLKAKRLEKEPAEEAAPAPAKVAPAPAKVDNAALVAPSPTSGASSPVGDLSTTKATESKKTTESKREAETVASRRVAQLLDGKEKEAFQLSTTQIELAKSRVFDINNFYVRKVEQTSLGTVFRGNLRTNSSVVFDLVTTQAAKVPELEKVKFLLLQDPTWSYADRLKARERAEDQEPVFLALPTEVTSGSQGLLEAALVLFGLGSSVICTLAFALSTFLLADGGAMLKSIEAGNLSPFEPALPIAGGLAALTLLHELGHLVAAQIHGLKTGVPILVPSLQVGVFGTVTRLLSLPKSNNALFDFAISGPVVAGAASFVLYLAGLFLSINLPTPDADAAAAMTAIPDLLKGGSDFLASSAAATSADASAYVPSPDLMPVLPTGLLQQSLLLDIIARAIVPAAGVQRIVTLHPLAVVGFVGCFINALQLMPIGKLDGGRAANSLLGQRNAAFLSASFLLVFTFLNFFTNDPVFFSWAAFCYFFQRTPDIPATNDLDSVDSQRQDIAKFVAAVALLTLLPFQGGAPPPPSGGIGF